MMLKQIAKAILPVPIRQAMRRWCREFMYLLPMQHGKIVFDNFNGKGFGDNPKYIALEILRQNLPYDLVWLVSEPHAEIPASIRQVPINGLRAIYELSTAQVIINNVKNGLPYKKKSSQFYIQTWHGGGHPTKKIEREIEELLPIEYIQSSQKDSQETDLFLSDGGRSDEWLREAFWYQGKILHCGLPRNDIYFQANEGDVEEIKGRLHIAVDCHCLLYAPTFRDAKTYNPYDLDIPAVLAAVTKRFGGKWKILVRLHPNDAKNSSLFHYDANVINASFYSDIQELFLISDAMITDYSSCFVDMVLFLQRPVFFYTSDLKRYVEESRGLCPEFFTRPFTRDETNEALVEDILTFDEATYRSQVEQYKAGEKDCSCGDASEQVVEVIKNVMNRSRIGESNEYSTY